MMSDMGERSEAASTSAACSGTVVCPVGWVWSCAWAGIASAAIPTETNQKDFLINPSRLSIVTVELLKRNSAFQHKTVDFREGRGSHCNCATIELQKKTSFRRAFDAAVTESALPRNPEKR